MDLCNTGYLVELLPGMFHIFPDESMLREDWCMGAIASTAGKKLFQRTASLNQPDGTTFRCLKSKEKAGKIITNHSDVVDWFSNLFNDTISLHHISPISRDNFYSYITTAKDEGAIYLWHTNNFVDSKRYIVAYINKTKSVCVDLTPFIKNRTPRDKLGIVITKNDSIEIMLQEMGLDHLPIKVIEYMSKIQLCETCGNIHNTDIGARLHRLHTWVNLQASERPKKSRWG